MLVMDCHGDAVQILKVISNVEDMATFTFSICRGLYEFLKGIQHGREPDYGDIDDFADMIGSTMRGIKGLGGR